MTPIVYPLTFDPGHTHTFTTSTNVTTTVSTIKWNLKVCRECKHSHFAGSKNCALSVGATVTLLECSCPEYVPVDNLEYLEWKFQKNESKKHLSHMSRSEVQS